MDMQTTAGANQAEDEEDAFVVEHLYLQNWDPVSRKLQ